MQNGKDRTEEATRGRPAETDNDKLYRVSRVRRFVECLFRFVFICCLRLLLWDQRVTSRCI